MNTIVLFYFKEEQHFIGQGVLEDYSIRTIEENDRSQSFKISLKLKEIDYYTDSVALDDICFSLEKVYRPKDPSIHFRQRYTYIEEVDFFRIKNAEYNMRRTALGMFLREMSNNELDELRIAFVKEARGDRKADFFIFFIDYLETNYYSIFELMSDSAILSQEFETDFNLAEITVSFKGFGKVKIPYGNFYDERYTNGLKEDNAYIKKLKHFDSDENDNLLDYLEQFYD
jgi:hypothetical protein